MIKPTHVKVVLYKRIFPCAPWTSLAFGWSLCFDSLKHGIAKCCKRPQTTKPFFQPNFVAVPITDYIVKSCQFLNPWDWLSKCSFRFANWHPVRRQHYRDVYQIPRYAFTWIVGYTMCKWFLYEDIRYLKAGFASMTAMIVNTPSNDICTMKSLNHASSMQEFKCSFSITFYVHYS